MKLQIVRLKGEIYTTKDFRDIDDSGEIAHFITELEIIKQELLELWEQHHELDK